MKFRTRLVACLLALAAVFLAAVPASASSDVTAGGSCKLSANWTVKVSINFNNTSPWTGIYNKGTVDYVVLSSPGQLDASSSSGSTADFYVTAGGGSHESGSPHRGFTLEDSSPSWVYRADFGGSAGIPNVYSSFINPKSSTGFYCTQYSNEANILTPA